MDALAALERATQHRALEERAVRDRRVDTHQVLVEAAARADREVTDLGVAHLPVRQARCRARRLEGRVRVVAPETVEHRRLRKVDGVSRPGRRTAEAVEDDERYEAPARHIATNDSRSRDAPPTSAPSITSCRSSSSALSGLTEPP